jgi:uncharacterized protein YPO0396
LKVVQQTGWATPSANARGAGQARRAQRAKHDAAQELRDQASAPGLRHRWTTRRSSAWTAGAREALGEHQLSVESCDNREQELRKWLQERIDAEDKRLARLAEKLVRAMACFKEEFKAETVEMDVAWPRWRVRAPAHRLEERRPAALRGTLQGAAQRQHHQRDRQLQRPARARARDDQGAGRPHQPVAAAIDYNPGRYIKLVAQPSPDAEIRDFQQDLRACTEGALTGSADEQYSEAKFLQVKAIIDRFRGREGLADADRRWTAKVTDVRNWFLFSASERWRADDSRARALLGLRRQVGRAEGKARLHRARREPGLPVRAGVGRGAFALVPLRRHRRGLRPRLGRVGAVRAAPVPAAQPAAADRHPAAEDPHHRALRRQRRLRAQRGGAIRGCAA